MNDQSERMADLLDSYLSDLQSGKDPSPPVELPGREISLLRKLVTLAKNSKPDQEFVKTIEQQLNNVAKQQLISGKTKMRQATPSHGLIAHFKEYIRTLNKRTFSIAVVSITVVLLVIISIFFFQKEQPISPTQVVEASTTSAVASPEGIAVAQKETEQPIIKTPIPLELASLPPLINQMQGEVGGGAQGKNGEPTDVKFVLNTALPESPGEMVFYVQDTQQLLTIEIVQLTAATFGLDPQVYTPFWMTQQSFGGGTPAAYIAIDEPLYIFFEGSHTSTYVDRNLEPVHGGHWYPPETLPTFEQALEIAKAFLENASLLEEPYLTLSNGDRIQFFHLLDSKWPLSRPFAQVYIHPNGQVKEMQHQEFQMESRGSYTILTAEEAWEILSTGPFDGRIWYQETQESEWAKWIHANPKFWVREYPVGQRVELFGPLQIFYPVDASDLPSIRMNDLVLEGDLGTLAESYQKVMEKTGDQEAPLHVWGEVHEINQVRILHVEAWEEPSQTFWFGTILLQNDQGFLVTGDGNSIPIPDLPSEISDGTSVYVQGGLWDEQLEWYIIQEKPEDEGGPGSPAGEGELTEAIVEEVDLIYFIPQSDSIPEEFASDPDYQTIQPVWRFKGHTHRGTAFEAYVQAADDAYLKDIAGTTGSSTQ